MKKISSSKLHLTRVTVRDLRTVAAGWAAHSRNCFGSYDAGCSGSCNTCQEQEACVSVDVSCQQSCMTACESACDCA
jgi:hypothetical protein